MRQRREQIRHRGARIALMLALALSLLGIAGCDATTPENTGASAQNSNTELKNEINTSQLPDSSFLYDASIADLAKATPFMNGQTVQVTGEVVGDRITDEYDNSFCWITLQDTGGSYSQIAVFIPKSLTSSIDTYGAYGRQGSMLQVRGIFNLACKDHDGVTCLHATNASKIAPGKAIDAPYNVNRLSVGAVALVLGLAMVFAHHKLREREL